MAEKDAGPVTPTPVSNEAKVAMLESVLEAVTRVLRYKDVSDFMESFWIVREVIDLRNERDSLVRLAKAEGREGSSHG